jgi:hypothetical protein
MYPGFKIDHTYMQLEDVLRMTENNKTIYNIFYGNMHSIDTEIANIIKDIKPEQTVLHSYNTDSHKVAKKLRNRGELDKIIREVCV